MEHSAWHRENIQQLVLKKWLGHVYLAERYAESISKISIFLRQQFV